MKLNLAAILSGFNLSKINTNFTDIENELQDKVLYRDNPVGEPNQMENVIDMNSNRIINVGSPADANDAARIQDVVNAVAGIVPASFIPFTPYLDIVATDVQGAVEEVKDDIEANEVALAASTGSGLIGFLYAAVYGAGTVGKWIQDLATSAGSSFIGFLQAGVGAVLRTTQSKLKTKVDVFDFMTPAEIADVQGFTYLLDVTAAIQAAATYVNTSRLSGATTSGALTTSDSGTGSTLVFPKGGYKITADIEIGGYTTIVGEDAIIKQFTDAENIFTIEAYQIRISGMQFIGGNFHLDIFNQNINSTLIDITNCQFFLSRSYAINTRATGGVYSHLSASFTMYKCRWIACNKVLNNCCDSAIIDHCWIQIDKNNFTANSAAIMNKGTTVGDPDAFTRLSIQNTFLIPDIGTEGVDRVNSARWIDNYGSVTSYHSRYGGEFGGLSILWHYGAPNLNFEYTSTEASFYNCILICGPDVRTDSGVVCLQGEVPNRIVIKNCSGPVGRPLILNLSSTNIPTYMSNYETNSGKKAYEYFKIDINDVQTDINAYSPARPMIPNDLYKFVVKGRQTIINRSTVQSITNGFATNLVSFDTIVSDNVGAWAIADPTRLVMPKGCSKMRITVNLVMAVDGAAKTMAVTLMTSGSVRISGDTSLRGINADSDRFCLTADVEGAPGSYWVVNVQHTAAAALNMNSAVVSLTALDYVG